MRTVLNMEKPLIDKSYKLEKFPGKGGWTYARITEIAKDTQKPFGWVKVKGTIDGYSISKYHLMPMGNGLLFLPVKAEIRKKIKKHAGDEVHVILYADNDAWIVPDEWIECLQDEPMAHSFFTKLSESEQKYYVHWIYGAKKEETKVNRMAKAINMLAEGKRFYNNEK